jgi:hypothetical protein
MKQCTAYIVRRMSVCKIASTMSAQMIQLTSLDRKGEGESESHVRKKKSNGQEQHLDASKRPKNVSCFCHRNISQRYVCGGRGGGAILHWRRLIIINFLLCSSTSVCRCTIDSAFSHMFTSLASAKNGVPFVDHRLRSCPELEFVIARNLLRG